MSDNFIFFFFFFFGCVYVQYFTLVFVMHLKTISTLWLVDTNQKEKAKQMCKQTKTGSNL